MRSFLRMLFVLAVTSAAASGGENPLGTRHVGSHRDVRALYRVGDTLWIGTGGGLFLYDLGGDMFVEQISVGERLPSNSVRSINALRDSVFVGTDRGLVIFDTAGVSMFTPHNTAGHDSVPLERIWGIDFGLDDVVYLSTYGLGIGVIDRDTSWVITRDDSLLDNKVYCTYQEDDTTFYFGTSMGLCAYRDSAWVGFQAGAGLPRGEVRQFIPSDDVGYYALIAGRGVYSFDGFSGRRVWRRGVFAEDDIAAIAVDAFGALWAGGRFGRIATYINEHWTRVGEGDAVIDGSRWKTAHADKVGSVFFGAADGVVAVLDERSHRTIQLPTGLPSGDVRSFAEVGDEVFFLNGAKIMRADTMLALAAQTSPNPIAQLTVGPSGALWAVGRWGVFRHEDGAFRELPVDVDDVDPVFTAIEFDAAGNLWLAERSGEIVRYDGEIWMRVASPGDAVTSTPTRLLGDGFVGVWVFAADGCARYDGAYWRRHNSDSFGGQALAAAARAPSGLLVAASERSLWGYDATEGNWNEILFHNANDDSVLVGLRPPSTVTAMCFDSDGRLYIGTELGLGLIDQSGPRWLTALDGVGGGEVADLFAGGGEALWVGFARDGLSRIPLKNLWTAAQP